MVLCCEINSLGASYPYYMHYLSRNLTGTKHETLYKVVKKANDTMYLALAMFVRYLIYIDYPLKINESLTFLYFNYVLHKAAAPHLSC